MICRPWNTGARTSTGSCVMRQPAARHSWLSNLEFHWNTLQIYE